MAFPTIDERIDAVTQNLQKICVLMDRLPDRGHDLRQQVVRLAVASPVGESAPFRNLSPALRQALAARLQRIPAAGAGQKSRAATAGR
jgi:hypothetical protein